MTREPGSFLAVNTALVLETLVEAIFAQVAERRAEGTPAGIAEVLETEDQSLAPDDERVLDIALRQAGYLARVAEVELFEPAQRPADWVPDVLRACFAQTGSWTRAVVDACADLARNEPVGKPSPDDPHAMSWRVPGPGGHVRHYVARRTIEDRLQGRAAPVDGDPAELKRAWLYGFFVRACEEALPAEAVFAQER